MRLLLALATAFSLACSLTPSYTPRALRVDRALRSAAARATNRTALTTPRKRDRLWQAVLARVRPGRFAEPLIRAVMPRLPRASLVGVIAVATGELASREMTDQIGAMPARLRSPASALMNRTQANLGDRIAILAKNEWDPATLLDSELEAFGKMRGVLPGQVGLDKEADEAFNLLLDQMVTEMALSTELAVAASLNTTVDLLRTSTSVYTDAFDKLMETPLDAGVEGFLRGDAAAALQSGELRSEFEAPVLNATTSLMRSVLDDGTFSRLDVNGDGQLSFEELYGLFDGTVDLEGTALAESKNSALAPVIDQIDAATAAIATALDEMDEWQSEVEATVGVELSGKGLGEWARPFAAVGQGLGGAVAELKRVALGQGDAPPAHAPPLPAPLQESMERQLNSAARRRRWRWRYWPPWRDRRGLAAEREVVEGEVVD